MPVLLHPKSLAFPPHRLADEDGLLAVGGDLSAERLLLAYRSGIFPWYGKDLPILWYCPDPRFVLLPEQLRVSKSMKQVLKRKQFEITCNQSFEGVINNCAAVPRPGQDSTWLIPEMIAAYTELHHLGHAHSVEAWQDGKLVGGFYGIRIGNCFFGESMFSHVSNASKAAFLTFVQQFKQEGGVLVDCQIHTPHLESLGGTFISLKQFLKLVQENT
jgi:leucyl/phenylalanyl-tRNA--protein transferase